MPDIAMCTGNCPVSENCYRYMAKPNSYGQTYSMLEPVCMPEDYSELIPYRENIKKEEKEREVDYTFADILLAEIHKLNETN
jgi:hypothetical protein